MKTVDVLLEEAALSVPELAEKTSISPDRMLAIVDGRWLPSPAERKKIAVAFAVAVDSISWGHTMSPRVVRYHRFGLKEDFKKRE